MEELGQLSLLIVTIVLLWKHYAVTPYFPTLRRAANFASKTSWTEMLSQYKNVG